MSLQMNAGLPYIALLYSELNQKGVVITYAEISDNTIALIPRPVGGDLGMRLNDSCPQ